MISQLLSLYFMISGVIFFITTGIAMIRFSDFYSRLHASSKSLTGGALSILLAYMVQSDKVAVILKLILMTLFLLITSPIAAQALARTAYRQRCDRNSIHYDEYELDSSDELS